MRIAALRAGTITRRYDGTARNTHHAWTAKNYVLVMLETDAGLAGLGEMYCDGGGTPEVAVAMLRHEVAPVLVGADARLPGAIVQALGARMALSARGSAASAAIAAVDIALWDLVGKIAGQPLYRLLGGVSDRAPVYASGGMYGPAGTPERLADAFAAARSQGLRGAKLKVGAASLDLDFARAGAVRAAIGPEAPLMVDAMFVPDVPGAIALARRLAPLDLHFLEAPTAPTDIAGWCMVARASGVPLAGPELSDDARLMRTMLHQGAVQYLQFDVAIARGITGGRALASLAALHHRRTSLHCAASAVALAAGAQLAAGLGNCDGLEFHLMHDGLREHLWASGWRLEEGCLVIPDRPGLGITLGEEERRMLDGA
ncbi:MAG: mandelate racemase/muconate lactonizing enzyme family protein [Acetobacteraceae bacterium]|nr:mandelate racemase/muconate lactonizing enzyme family protein [Acetobacteraceae bacterium]